MFWWNKNKLKQTYSYDDVTLIPQYSSLLSRSDTNPSMFKYKLPIICSCMDTLGPDMANLFIQKNIPFIAHRSFKSAAEQFKTFTENLKFKQYINECLWFAVGSVQKYKDWIDYLYNKGIRRFCVDMAHGDSKACIDTIKYIKDIDKFNQNNNNFSVHVIAGNVATVEGFKRLQKAGADGIRVGIASGSICFTPNTKVWYVSNSGKTYQKDIQFIDINDKVLTASGKTRKVINKFINDYTGEVYKINDIYATPNHKFHVFNNETRQKEFIEIKNIDPNIHSFINVEGKTEKINIDLEEYSGKVYNIEVEDEHTYTVGNKCLGVSNCSTALQTAMGVPILTNIMECAKIKKNTWLIADGRN